jgi:hypothetical protein
VDSYFADNVKVLDNFTHQFLNLKILTLERFLFNDELSLHKILIVCPILTSFTLNSCRFLPPTRCALGSVVIVDSLFSKDNNNLTHLSIQDIECRNIRNYACKLIINTLTNCGTNLTSLNIHYKSEYPKRDYQMLGEIIDQYCPLVVNAVIDTRFKKNSC